MTSYGHEVFESEIGLRKMAVIPLDFSNSLTSSEQNAAYTYFNPIKDSQSALGCSWTNSYPAWGSGVNNITNHTGYNCIGGAMVTYWPKWCEEVRKRQEEEARDNYVIKIQDPVKLTLTYLDQISKQFLLLKGHYIYKNCKMCFKTLDFYPDLILT